MRSGTIIRLIISLLIIIIPIIVTNIWEDAAKHGLYALYVFYICLPLMYMWEVICSDCDACIMSGKCEQIKKEKLIKYIMQFFGFDKNQLIKISSLKGCNNNYFNIYKYIKNEYMKNQSRIDELNREIQQNSEDYNNGSITYEELHALQRPLVQERNELLK